MHKKREREKGATETETPHLGQLQHAEPVSPLRVRKGRARPRPIREPTREDQDSYSLPIGGILTETTHSCLANGCLARTKQSEQFRARPALAIFLAAMVGGRTPVSIGCYSGDEDAKGSGSV